MYDTLQIASIPFKTLLITPVWCISVFDPLAILCWNFCNPGKSSSLRLACLAIIYIWFPTLCCENMCCFCPIASRELFVMRELCLKCVDQTMLLLMQIRGNGSLLTTPRHKKVCVFIWIIISSSSLAGATATALSSSPSSPTSSSVYSSSSAAAAAAAAEEEDEEKVATS